MRALPALLAVPVLAAPLVLAAAAPARDWARTCWRTAAGAYVHGNPAAPVKIVEYASYTCPHCAAFASESAATLDDKWIGDGSTSLEFRHLIRDPADLAAAIIARCTGVRGFVATSARIYAQQPQWLSRAINFQQTNASRINLYPPLARLRAIADGSGLTDIGRAAGLSDARLDQCFADQAEVDRIVAMTGGASGVDSTPTFFVNGRKLDGSTWARVEPQLRALGAH